MTTELQTKAHRLLALRKKLERYKNELVELRELEASFSPDALAMIDALSGSNGKVEDTGTPNEFVRKWLVEHIFSGNKKQKPQKIDQALKLACEKQLKSLQAVKDAKMKITTADVSSAVKFYCDNHKVEGKKGKSALWQATDRLFVEA